MELNKKNLIRLGLLVCTGILVFCGLQNLGKIGDFILKFIGVIFPVLLGFIFAFILNLPMKQLEKHFFAKSSKKIIQKIRRPACIFLSFIFILAVLSFVVLLVLPELINTFGILGTTIPPFVEQVKEWLLRYADQVPQFEAWVNSLNINWNVLGEKVFGIATNGAFGILDSTVSIVTSIFGGLINLAIALIFSIFVLINKEKLASQCKKLMAAYLPGKWTARILKVSALSSKIFANFITGQCTEAVILGILCTLGMSLFRFPYAPMVGALIGFTALIPVAGAYIGAIVGAFLILMVSPLKALTFLIFLVILQQIEGNIIYPRVVGSSVGLPGMWVLAAVTIGGSLSGIIGMLFAVPVASIIYSLLGEHVNQKIKTENILIPENKPLKKPKG